MRNQFFIKAISAMLTVMMTFSFAVTSVGATTYSAQASEKANTQVSSQRAVDEDQIYPKPNQIGLELLNSCWEDAQTVYCHIFNAKTGEELTQWQSSEESMEIICDDFFMNMAVFDVEKSGFDIDENSKADYGVIFSNDLGQTTNVLTLDGTCLGKVAALVRPHGKDTVTENQKHNAKWYGRLDCGTHFAISDTGEVTGAYLYDFENGYDIMSDYLINACLENGQINSDEDNIQLALDKLKLDTRELLNVVSQKLNAKQPAVEIDSATLTAVNSKISDVVGGCINPATRKNIYVYSYVDFKEKPDYIYCSVRRVDGTGDTLPWHCDAEKCTFDECTGLATYDLNNTNFEFESNDEKAYFIMFSDSLYDKTFELIADSSCIGDTAFIVEINEYCSIGTEDVYCTSSWQNSTTCGQIKSIACGSVIGDTQPLGKTDEMMFADYLIEYWDSPAYMSDENIRNLYSCLNISMPALEQQLQEKLAYNANKDVIFNKLKSVLYAVRTLGGTMFGDVNNDQRVTVEDATQMQRILANIEKFEYKYEDVKSDVNRDGYVTVEDATLVQRMICEAE